VPESSTEQGLIYKSSDENVLTVNEAGKVDVNSTGAAIVTVTSEGNNAKGEQEVDSLLFIITEPVTGIEMDQDSTVLNPEDKYQIKAKITPDNATRQGVTYTSDNEAVATVNETGGVTAGEPGFATITITSNGHDENGKNVEKDFGLIVADIELNTDDMNLTAGETFQLDAKFTPEDVMNSNVIYGSSDFDVVSINERGEIKALKEGTAKITVSSEAYSNITESFEVSVKDKKDEVNADSDKDNSTKPTKPQGNKNQTKDNQQVVEKAKDPITGDSTNVTAVVIIMIISGAAILYLNRRKKLH
jgi:LPXTG-motif cell wall-anchored protein